MEEFQVHEAVLRRFGGAVSTIAIGALRSVNAMRQRTMELAKRQEQAEAKLASVIRATGKAAGYSAAQMQDMAAVCWYALRRN